MKISELILELHGICKDLHWMARRYADGRQSYATGLFNRHTRKLLKLGVQLNPTGDETLWVRDSGGRAYDGLSEEEAAAGRPPDWKQDGMQRRNEELEAENLRLREELKQIKEEKSVCSKSIVRKTPASINSRRSSSTKPSETSSSKAT